MQLFETALKNFWFLGMEWDDSSQKFAYSLKKNLYAYGVSVVCITCTLSFLIHDAVNFDEYTEALFIFSSAIMCNIITTFLYIKLDVLSEFVKICRNSIGESEWNVF